MLPSWIQRINGFRRDCISSLIFFFLVSCLSVFICVLACTLACRCPQIGSSWRLSCRQLGVPSISAVQILNCWVVSLTPLPWTSFHFLCKEGLWQGTRRASIYLPWWVPSTLLNTPPVIFYPKPLSLSAVETSALLCYFSHRPAISMRSLPNTPAHCDHLLQTPTYCHIV